MWGQQSLEHLLVSTILGKKTLHFTIGLLLSRREAKIILPLCIILASRCLIPIAYTNSWNMYF